jgi:hypothetical protein
MAKAPPEETPADEPVPWEERYRPGVPAEPNNDEEREWLEAAVAAGLDWISPVNAVKMIRDHLSISEGRARAMLQTVCTAVPSEVRSCNDDPAQRWEKSWCICKSDLLDWLDRQPVPAAATEAPPRSDSAGGYKEKAALQAISKIFGNAVPDQAQMSNKTLCIKVREKLSSDMASPPEKGGISDDTILLAAGRRQRGRGRK